MILGEQITSIATGSIQPPSEVREFKLKRLHQMDFNRYDGINLSHSFSGTKIYEWNIDGFTDRQIYNTIRRIRMYSTICEVNGNKDKAIAEMIVAGFTGQLQGWWDNYLTAEHKATIMGAVKVENGQNVQNAVDSLAINIIEHFSGGWSDNSETIRTMLHNLRCKTSTPFRWYKDVFVSGVMKLPECNSTLWKSKFIDGLPPLFAERVRKTLRGTSISIDYNSYTYGDLISVCNKEGLALRNEFKLEKQMMKHRRR